MMKAKLYTRSGEYVITAILPPFMVPAEGLYWGNRAFFWNAEHEQYREGLLYPVMDTEQEVTK